MKKKTLITSLIALISGVLIFFAIYLINKNDENITVVAPTCIENGYTIYQKDGITQIKDVVIATGHQFGDWKITSDSDGINGGLKEHTCQVCGAKEYEQFYDEIGLPCVFFEGDLSQIGKTQQVNVLAKFVSDEINFDGYAKLKYQGHSSLKYDKKNFTVKFYKDEECKEKNLLVFEEWLPENKFILKANYIDGSRCRNLVCADIWSQFVSTREGAHNRLLQTSNNGAIDGFPIAVYLNGEFLGLYNLTLHKDDGLFDMKDGNKDGIVISNKGDSPEALFQGAVDWTNSWDWEIEYCGTEHELWIQQKLNDFIGFVMNSSDEEFKNNLSGYVDVNSLIDYMIACYALGLNENFTKDLVFITYDDGVWIASLFDMENAFGLIEEQRAFALPTENLPLKNDQLWSSGTDSLLWDRLINAFFDQIAQRYAELRKDILSESSIEEIIDERIAAVSQNVNSADFQLYPDQPFQEINHSDQMKNYTKNRLELLDHIFSTMCDEE